MLLFQNSWPRRSLPCNPFLTPSWSSLSRMLRWVRCELIVMPCSRSLSICWRTYGVDNCPLHLFVFLDIRSRSMNVILFLREIIAKSGSSTVPRLASRALKIKGVSTSATFYRTWSVLVFLMQPVDGHVQCSHNFTETILFLWVIFIRPLCSCWGSDWLALASSD